METSGKQAHVAVITGSGQGIGRAIAQKLASEGCRLVLGDLLSNMSRLLEVSDECARIQRETNFEGLSPSILPMSCDVSVKADVDALVQMAIDQMGGIDVMVANAGIYRAAPIVEMSDEMFDQVYAVNVKGVFHCYQAAARAMIPRGGGRIIGACSASGKGGALNKAAYCSSKFAVRGLTQSAAREWGKYGITVNTYAPGPVDTDMWNKDVLGGITGGDHAQRVILDRLPTGRISSPDDIAGLVSFLVSPAAKNITGQSISIDGGFCMD